MNKEEDVILILHVMKMTHDKFLKKNDLEVFRNSSTLLWLLCQDLRVARVRYTFIFLKQLGRNKIGILIYDFNFAAYCWRKYVTISTAKNDGNIKQKMPVYKTAEVETSKNFTENRIKLVRRS